MTTWTTTGAVPSAAFTPVPAQTQWGCSWGALSARTMASWGTHATPAPRPEVGYRSAAPQTQPSFAAPAYWRPAIGVQLPMAGPIPLTSTESIGVPALSWQANPAVAQTPPWPTARVTPWPRSQTRWAQWGGGGG